MTHPEASWAHGFDDDIIFGYQDRHSDFGPRRHHPRIVDNGSDGQTTLRVLREELARCQEFAFSVAFVTPAAIALLKQELVDFTGTGRIITSDYLSFNSPRAFAELLNLRGLGIDVRIHSSEHYHPKGYVFRHDDIVTTMMGSSNLTAAAITSNREWNLKVSARRSSDLAGQIDSQVHKEHDASFPLTAEWIERYAKSYIAPVPRRRRTSIDGGDHTEFVPNAMQADALDALERLRATGEDRGLLISATGTGKTILSALDVRAVDPSRMLLLVHREEILDRALAEYRRVIGGPENDFGKVANTTQQIDRRFVFASIQTLCKPKRLAQFAPDSFEYIVIDEAHHAVAASYRQVLRHFRPKFLLGMTATPERLDEHNVYEIFDHNVPYEIRLNHALEAGMLCPFHYYGVADVTFDDGTTTDDTTALERLTAETRVRHLVRAIETYGQAGVPPRGLIFCSRTEEARRLSELLNRTTLRGVPLRTQALTGKDDVDSRATAVTRLERGELDYLLTVDLFNEGVDIPTINQVIMLRQTKSPTVFVQQLGRGLRKAEGKDYLVVIDLIGNYTNNFVIPIALFGDGSLSKDLLRQRLIAAEESGVLPGLASVRFDKIAQQRVLRSIASTKLDSHNRLKDALVEMSNRVGGVPRLWDFHRFESVDPVVLATRKGNYPALVEWLLQKKANLSASEHETLRHLSHEVLPARRRHEFVVLRRLLADTHTTKAQLLGELSAAGLPATADHLDSALDTLSLDNYGAPDLRRFGSGLIIRSGDAISLSAEVAESYSTSSTFRREVDDIVETGSAMASAYDSARPFTPGRQYSRREVARILCWPRSWVGTINGYRVDVERAVCPIFVTLHKAHDISVNTAYEDALLSPSRMLWYTRNPRKIESDEIQPILRNKVWLPVFVKKDDADGQEFFYLGDATAEHPEQTTMRHDMRVPVVRMQLHFATPIDTALYDYLNPTVLEHETPGDPTI